MKFKNYILTVAVFTLVLLVGCSDSSTDPTPEGNNSGSYYPSTVGSEWTYSRTVGTYSDEYTMIVSKDTVVKDKKYALIYSPSYPTLKQLLRSDNTGLYAYYIDSLKEIRIDLFGDVGSKDVNYRSEIKNGITIVYREPFTVIQKNVSRNINGKTYNNCIVIKKDTYANMGTGQEIFIATTENTYSAGIGLVESKGSTSNGSQTALVYLKSYSIK